MSYVVDVVSGETPTSYADAFGLRNQAADAQNEHAPALSAGMLELYRELTARYPCIVDNPDGPWSDGPLISNFGQEIATLGISYSRVEEVLPLLVHEAIAMGFWVLDPQQETVHLPGGGTLPEEREGSHSHKPKPWWRFW